MWVPNFILYNRVRFGTYIQKNLVPTHGAGTKFIVYNKVRFGTHICGTGGWDFIILKGITPRTTAVTYILNIPHSRILVRLFSKPPPKNKKEHVALSRKLLRRGRLKGGIWGWGPVGPARYGIKQKRFPV